MPLGTDLLRGSRALHALVLLLLCLGVYSNSFDHELQLDSHHVVEQNPSIRSLANAPDFFLDPGTSTNLKTNADYRPVLTLSYALNHAMGGYTMFGWHLAQVLLHFLCALGLYGVCRKLVREIAGGEAETLGAWIAFASALLFALHPTASGVVNYLAARSSLLTAAFLFGAVNAYMVPFDSERRGRTRWLAAVLFGLALFTKVEAIAGLGVFVLYEVWQRARASGGATSFPADLIATPSLGTLRRLWPCLAIAAAYLAIRSAVMADFVYEVASARPDVGPFPYLLTQLTAWWYYLWHWFVPLGLVADNYPYPVQRSLADPLVLGALASWLAVATVLLLQWRRRPYLLFLAGSALALLSPTSSVVPLAEMVNEHRPYMPVALLSLGWMVFLGLRLRGTRLLKPAGAAVAVAAAALGWMTYQRNEVFLTKGSYWADVVAKAPSPRAYTGYASAIEAGGDLDRILDNLEKALELAPYYHYTHMALAKNYAKKGEHALALEHHDKAVEYDPLSGTALTRRGEYLLTRKRFADALADFEASVPKSLERYRNLKGLATAHAGLGRADEAFALTMRCFEINAQATLREIPMIAAPFGADPKLYPAGVEYFQKLKERMPGEWWVHQNLGVFAQRLGRTELALEALAEAQRLQALQKQN